MYSIKTKVAVVHFGVSILIACLAALMVFGVWFPAPYDELSGGIFLFLLIVSIDIIIGPVITWIVFNPSKRKLEKYFDLTIIGIIQAGALTYGLHSTYLARPIYLVHEIDRFVVVSAADVDANELSKAPKNLQNPKLGFVKILGLREIKDPIERMKSVELALGGKDVSLRPEYWQDISTDNIEMLKKKSRPLPDLLQASPAIRGDADALIKKSGLNAADLIYLPIVGKRAIWSAVLTKKDIEIIGFLKIDGFTH